MTMLQIIFYLFSAVLLFSTLMVVLLRNPVHSVLFLIFAFFNAAGLFVMLGAEFIAMTLVSVYVGAVAVLFLFVVMMLNVKASEIKEGFTKHAVLGAILALCVMVQMMIAVINSGEFLPPSVQNAEMLQNNTYEIGRVLYTDYLIEFQAAGLVLLVAMIAAIVLTLVDGRGVAKVQNICRQTQRTRAQSVELMDVATGKGVEL